MKDDNMPDTAPVLNAAAADAREATITARLSAMTKPQWIMLAKLAWMDNPASTVALQMSENTGVGLRNCQYYLSMKDKRMPHADMRRRAFDLASEKFNRYAALLDELEGLEGAPPPTAASDPA